jgi:tetratricopeptide (TPR) repeat protein
VLEAESLLAIGDYAGAEAAYRSALRPALPPEWRALVHVRLATLRASSDPAGALAELGTSAPRYVQPLPSIAAFITPLLPAVIPDARQLTAALRAAPDQRPQMLGQLYLSGGLYALAEAQFGVVAPDSPSALAAAAYAAYARWSAGDRAEGLRRLGALVASHPNEPRARALLALAYLSNRDEAGARTQLEVVRSLAPRAPDTHLAWGQWYAAQHDYLAASEEYRRALDDAPLDERGPYALALAQFHLDTSVQVCEAGRPAAEEAARLLPEDTRAWVALAAARFACGDAGGARGAAVQALQRNPASAEASYYLGRALAVLGERAAARLALINAADLAPASPWRERAETQIVTLGL